MFGTGRRGRGRASIWPGYVDALATLLMVFIFMLTIFMTAQLYLSDALSDRDDTLQRLRADLQELSEVLSLERAEREALEETLEATQAQLIATLSERRFQAQRADDAEAASERLRQRLAERETELAEREAELAEALADVDTLEERLAEAEEARVARAEELAEEQELTRQQADRIDALRRDLRALRDQLAAVSRALDIERATAATQRLEIEDLGRRLNIALAERVEELERYRSEFFANLRDILGDREDITIDGDRFRFQSELFFDTGSAEVGAEGREQLNRLADTLEALQTEIPEGVEWILQVEGHTDRRPIATPQFPSNWELSLARAQAIVHYLIDRGVPPHRLVAAGFGEYHPIDDANTPEAYAQNRRIELRLTNP